jgi:hypothetical protein
MPAELHVQFRLPAAHARRLKARAELLGASPNLAARSLLIDSLDDRLREDLLGQISALLEDLAALRADQREQATELSQFHAEFLDALRKTLKERG